MKRAAIMLLVVTGLVLLVRWWMLGDPSWYAPPDPKRPEVVQLAERTEYRLVEEFQKIRPAEDTWTIRIHALQINAWLSARLPEWIEHQGEGAAWPEELGTPQIRLKESGVLVALPMRLELAEEMVQVEMLPAIGEGRLIVPVERIGVGRLLLPSATSEDLMGIAERFIDERPGMDEDVETVLGYLTGAESFDPVFDLADGRRVRAVKLTFRDGAVDVTCRTERGE